MTELLTPQAAAKVLGVSSRKVYDLAAPQGPIACQRIGRTVRFQLSDILEYQTQCRCTAIKAVAAGSLSSAGVSTDDGSELESYFRRRGREPRLMPTIGKSRRSSTPQPAASVHPIRPLIALSPST